MQPRQMRDTFSPVEPRLTYSIAPQAKTEMHEVKPRHREPPALKAGVGTLGAPCRPSNPLVPPKQRPSPWLVARKLQASCKPVVSLFEASSLVCSPCAVPASTPPRRFIPPRPGRTPGTAPTTHIESQTAAEVTQILRCADSRRAHRPVERAPCSRTSIVRGKR